MLLASSGVAVLETGSSISGASVGGRVDGDVTLGGAVTLGGLSVVETEGGAMS